MKIWRASRTGGRIPEFPPASSRHQIQTAGQAKTRTSGKSLAASTETDVGVCLGLSGTSNSGGGEVYPKGEKKNLPQIITSAESVDWGSGMKPTHAEQPRIMKCPSVGIPIPRGCVSRVAVLIRPLFIELRRLLVDQNHQMYPNGGISDCQVAKSTKYRRFDVRHCPGGATGQPPEFNASTTDRPSPRRAPDKGIYHT